MLPAAVLLLFWSLLADARPSDKNLWIAGIRRDTTTSPIPSPPAAAHALRDPSKLKYEVVGIVGAYILWLIATIILLVFIGTRLRRKATTIANVQNMTMMKTFNSTAKSVEIPKDMKSPGLKSPLQSIKSWGKKSHKANPSDFSISTVQSIESSAHQQNKAKDMDELTKLYAAVMAQDEQRSQGHNSAAQSPEIPDESSPLSPGYPPEFAHMHSVNAPTQMKVGPTLDEPLHHPMAPTPVGDTFPQDARTHYDPNIASRNSQRTNRSTPMSVISDMGSRAGSVMSPRGKPSRISVRSQGISQPIGSADLRDAHHYEETVPLSPRVYTPGPPPPTPGRKKQAQVTVQAIDEDMPVQQNYQHYQQYEDEYDDQEPYMQSQQPYQQPPLTQNPRERRAPAALTLRSAALQNASASAATAHPANAPKNLLFRDMYGDASMRSAPPTKTTFLDRPYQQSSGPRTGVVPSTPYSPYMPNTPMTPITPRRLLNKQELKARRKEEQLKVLNENDMVETEDDMWGK